jgi:hypothetical protein
MPYILFFFFSFLQFSFNKNRVLHTAWDPILIYCHLLPTISFLIFFSIFLWMNNYCLLVLFIYYTSLISLSILVRIWIYYWFQFGILKRESFNANFIFSNFLMMFCLWMHSTFKKLQCDYDFWTEHCENWLFMFLDVEISKFVDMEFFLKFMQL